MSATTDPVSEIYRAQLDEQHQRILVAVELTTRRWVEAGDEHTREILGEIRRTLMDGAS